MVKPRTIALAYASVGSGHRVAAESIAAELEARHEGELRVELLDALEYAYPSVSGNLLASTFTGPTAGLYDAIWGGKWVGRFSRSLSAPLLSGALSSLSRRLAEIAPDVVVCTHALPSVVASRSVRKGHESFAVVNVATDYGVHSFWPRRGVALFCVADDASAEVLAERGFARESIAVTGIPVRHQFTLDYDRLAARQHFGLPAEGRVVLALAGSTMPGPYEALKEALAVSLPALATLPQTTVAVVTGRDEAFAEELRARSKGFGTTNVRIFGYVEHVGPLMAAADLGLAKPGGSVCAEAMASQLPLVLVGPAAGQEHANAKALTTAGSAVFSADPRTLAEYVRKVIAKPGRLAALKAASGKLSKPFAAADVADRVLAMADAGSTTPQG